MMPLIAGITIAPNALTGARRKAQNADVMKPKTKKTEILKIRPNTIVFLSPSFGMICLIKSPWTTAIEMPKDASERPIIAEFHPNCVFEK
tara:strand:- start:155 stop:424 length:270 start_codon:yes stop_codon:yes gene_type:complete